MFGRYQCDRRNIGRGFKFWFSWRCMFSWFEEEVDRESVYSEPHCLQDDVQVVETLTVTW